MVPKTFAEWRRTHPPIMGADLTTNSPRTRPPKDNLVRAASPNSPHLLEKGVGVQVRADADGGDGRTLHGHFTVFNEWTEINSIFEGQFLERIAPGASKKTLREQTPKILFQHGMDPQLGDRVIAAAPDVLREDETGPYFEARVLDGLDPLILEGLRAGVYGISFRFSVVREEWVDEPDASDYNPRALPERTIKEMRISEFGPVTFPAYPGADVGLRSLTDEVMLGRATSDMSRDQLRAVLAYLEKRDERPAQDPHPDPDAADAPGDVTAADQAAATELPGAEAAPENKPAPPEEGAGQPPADAGQQDTNTNDAPEDRAAHGHPADGRVSTTGRASLFGLYQEDKSWRL